MIKFSVSLLLCSASVLIVLGSTPADTASADDAKVPPAPPARKIPGITAPDPYPMACVDCHTKQPDGTDLRISTLMKKWSGSVDARVLAAVQTIAPQGVKLKGKHLPLGGALKDVPAACMKCHGAGSKMAPSFAQLVHTIHLTGSQQNRFLTLFNGECTYCHKWQSARAMWSIPSGPEK